MRLLLTLIVVPSLTLLGFLIPDWTTIAVLVYIGLWIVFGGAVLSFWIEKHAYPILRITALTIGLFYIFAAIDTILGVVQSGQSPGARNPIFGLLIIGIPALIFAITGCPKFRVEFDDSDSSEAFDFDDELSDEWDDHPRS